MKPKAETVEMVQRFRDDMTWNEIAQAVTLMASIQEGLEDIRNGKGIPHEQVMREMDEWLESSGHPEPKPNSNRSTNAFQKTR